MRFNAHATRVLVRKSSDQKDVGKEKKKRRGVDRAIDYPNRLRV